MTETAKEIIPVNLEDEMRRSYLDYAMSVIVGRALPDVRDGLKPSSWKMYPMPLSLLWMAMPSKDLC